MYNALVSFYKYGFVIFKDVPTKDNFLINFANSIGSVRRTNCGEYFNVKSVPSPNDLAYTSLALAPHTDNPYRNPVPSIQILHCIENEVKGGNVPKEFVPSVEKGFKAAMKNGVLAGYQMDSMSTGHLTISEGPAT